MKASLLPFTGPIDVTLPAPSYVKVPVSKLLAASPVTIREGRGRPEGSASSVVVTPLPVV